ncbi:MAG: PEP-utilizing enzyme [Thermodesulfobacteriaceae bacterium]|nr:PEP-utilizing enzyme [Thermodesulfobacteriaceae bacterium]
MKFLAKLLESLSGKKDKNNFKNLLKLKYVHFQQILNENNQILKIIAELEDKKATGKPFDRSYLMEKLNQIFNRLEKLIFHLNELSQKRYLKLNSIYQEIKNQLENYLYPKLEISLTELTYPLDLVTRKNINCSGRKMANLGELKNVLQLKTPEGFVITSYAFLSFLKYNQLEEKITQFISQLYRIDTLKELETLSQKLQQLILEAKIPEDLEREILKAYETLIQKVGYKCKLAIRSSAILEDTEFTFGGQFSSFLNVSEEEILEKYKKVLASLFNPQALFAYKTKGLPQHSLAMAVGVLSMVKAKASGVIYTLDPNDPTSDYMLISAVKGLGSDLVSGLVCSENYLVKKDSLKILKMKTENLTKSILSEKEILELAQKALLIEKHYQSPRDIEWSIDENGEIVFLQTRLLKMRQDLEWEKLLAYRVEGYKILLEEGTIASKGIGYGRVFILNENKSLSEFQKGDILVSRHTRPQYAVIMDKASAAVTDIGSATGHMASIAREYQVPMIVNTKLATKILKDGQEITVDAINGIIYEGKVVELLEKYYKLKETVFKKTSLYQTLNEILKYITPLNITLPSHSDFKLENCKTVHDITRFAHEMAMNELFNLGKEYNTQDLEPAIFKDKIPLEILVLDIEGGLKEHNKKIILLEDIQSNPFLSILKGMLTIKWPEAPPVDLEGFLGLIFTTALTPEKELLEAGKRSFCIIAKNYVNFNIRMGYHFSTIEAYIGEDINDNYIKFFFKGGGADTSRRQRRLLLLEQILKRLGFCVKLEEDVLEARLTKYEEEHILKILENLGKLVVYTKQLDVALYNDSITQKYIDEFIQSHLSEI